MPGAQCHGEVSDEGIDSLAAAVRDHRAPTCLSRHLDRGDRLRERADLVQLDEHRIRDVLVDTACDPLHIGHEEIVSHQLDLAADGLIQVFPPGPVVLRQPVFQDDDRISPTH